MDEAGLDELLHRARRRDEGALSELVQVFSSRVYGLLYRLTGSRDAAEDLLQETFLRVVRVIDQYEHVGRFEAWLFRIAGNLARDRARKLGRRGESSLTDDVAEELVADSGRHAGASDDPAEALDRREAGAQLVAGLERLSAAEKEVILLRHYSELSFREIAAILNVPLGTALARAHRALRRLRADLGGED